MKKESKSKVTKVKIKSNERDRFTVVLEGIQAEFKVFGESLAGLRDSTNSRFNDNSRELKALRNGIADVNMRLDSHTEMIAQVMVDTAEIKNDLKQKVDRDEFAKLEKRVLKLEHPAIA